MPITSRTRSRSSPEILLPGTGTSRQRIYDADNELLSDFTYPDPAGGEYISLRENVCSDVVGNREGDNPLYIDHSTNKAASFSWTLDHVYDTNDGDDQFAYKTRFQSSRTGSIVPYHVLGTDETAVSDLEFITSAVAAVNPSKPSFDAAVFIGELREAPKLLQSVGRDMWKYGANEYLKVQYGWKPFARDLSKLIHAVDKIDKLVKKMEKLTKDGKVRLRYDPDAPEVTNRSFRTESYAELITSTDGVILVDATTLMVTRRWCDCVYKLDPILGAPKTNREMLLRAKRALYGGTVDGSTLWELMPWSWLYDWTSNASEFLMSQRNVVGAELDSVCLMKTTQRSTVYQPVLAPYPSSPVQGGNVAFGSTFIPGSKESTTIERIVDLMPAVTITKELALFAQNPFKQSILGALGVQRFRGKLSF